MDDMSGPNIFYPRWPNWCSGYDETPFAFENKEHLLQCPHINHFVSLGHEIQIGKKPEEGRMGFQYEKPFLMAVNEKYYWAIGTFKRYDSELYSWFKVWRE